MEFSKVEIVAKLGLVRQL